MYIIRENTPKIFLMSNIRKHYVKCFAIISLYYLCTRIKIIILRKIYFDCRFEFNSKQQLLHVIYFLDIRVPTYYIQPISFGVDNEFYKKCHGNKQY